MGKLYELLGGEAAVQAATIGFYEKVMADPSLAPYFRGLHMDAQVKKFIAFMTMALGGPHSYTGRDLRSAHQRLVNDGLGEPHFDAILVHLEQTLTELGIDPDLIEQTIELVASTHGDVLCLPQG
ncbi:group I truncated hemoglobin [Paraliomyxa miuraensis]|uniref:group I truncated hemoglobin n=1 Tax=Paraliomyxa miuraensis TaxID=376150 RepID=UPI002252D98F|nr:group 1 truncated hemoglobin [Paraliomyxa miuraensis]MCX4241427.1 group 1 truncated hemoglobin [Paraliomyxa miuraensis]